MIEQRLHELREELRRGQQALAAMDSRRKGLHRTLLRISGAVQVLEELTAARRASKGCGAEDHEPTGMESS